MNTLARTIHALINQENIQDSAPLSLVERGALADLQILLTQSSRELARYLAENPRPDAWPTVLLPEPPISSPA